MKKEKNLGMEARRRESKRGLKVELRGKDGLSAIGGRRDGKEKETCEEGQNY